MRFPEWRPNQVKVVKSNGADFAMFKTSESKVVQDGEELEITLSTKNVSFDKIYFGYKDDELKESVANGTEANGEWSFTFHLPASAKGTTIPVTLGKPDGCRPPPDPAEGSCGKM